jgi:serine/threonine-protein kinase RsbW
VSAGSELRLRCPAHSRYVAPVRHALSAFLQALEFDRHALEDVTTAAGEALANIVEHAYARSAKQASRYLELRASIARTGTLAVDVSDGGSFVERAPLPGRGFGLRIIRAIAGRLTIDTSSGTRVSMTFEPKR